MLKFIGQLCVMFAVILTLLGMVLSFQRHEWTSADYLIMAFGMLVVGAAFMDVEKHKSPGAPDGQDRQA